MKHDKIFSHYLQKATAEGISVIYPLQTKYKTLGGFVRANRSNKLKAAESAIAFLNERRKVVGHIAEYKETINVLIVEVNEAIKRLKEAI